jgi:type II secretory pathway pseudopilin PulG
MVDSHSLLGRDQVFPYGDIRTTPFGSWPAKCDFTWNLSMCHIQAIARFKEGRSGSVPSQETETGRTSAFRKPSVRSATSAVTLVEVMIAVGLLALTIVASVQALLVSYRLSAANRLMTAARAIVQRNIDTALTLRFDSTTTPGVLAITSDSGANYDDDNVNDGSVNVLTQKDASGNPVPLVKGTLRRKVTAIANAQGADIRRVEFSLTYPFRSRSYTVEMTTIRTIDD